MNERLLCKCSNSIIAHDVIDVLTREDIIFRQHDETHEPHSGTYGPTPGIAIYVPEEDYEKALLLVDLIVNPPADSTKPFCPKCGSEDVGGVVRSKYTSSLLILSIFLFILPIAYLYFTKGAVSPLMYWLSIATFISSLVIVLVCHRNDADYKCNQCGKKFRRIR